MLLIESNVSELGVTFKAFAILSTISNEGFRSHASFNKVRCMMLIHRILFLPVFLENYQLMTFSLGLCFRIFYTVSYTIYPLKFDYMLKFININKKFINNNIIKK